MLGARQYIVKGRVQRVGFRMFAEDAARRESIDGYVRNRHDGNVEIVAEGDLDALQRFEMSIRRGPPGARVDDVDTTILEPVHTHKGFRIHG